MSVYTVLSTFTTNHHSLLIGPSIYGVAHLLLVGLRQLTSQCLATFGPKDASALTLAVVMRLTTKENTSDIFSTLLTSIDSYSDTNTN